MIKLNNIQLNWQRTYYWDGKVYNPNPLKSNKREKGNERNKKGDMFFATKGSYYFGSGLIKPIKDGEEIYQEKRF